MFGIPVPCYALVNRETPYQELDYFIEQEDYVEVHGKRFLKPFVEKPIHGEDLHYGFYLDSVLVAIAFSWGFLFSCNGTEGNELWFLTIFI